MAGSDDEDPSTEGCVANGAEGSATIQAFDERKRVHNLTATKRKSSESQSTISYKRSAQGEPLLGTLPEQQDNSASAEAGRQSATDTSELIDPNVPDTASLSALSDYSSTPPCSNDTFISSFELVHLEEQSSGNGAIRQSSNGANTSNVSTALKAERPPDDSLILPCGGSQKVRPTGSREGRALAEAAAPQSSSIVAMPSKTHGGITTAASTSAFLSTLHELRTAEEDEPPCRERAKQLSDKAKSLSNSPGANVTGPFEILSGQPSMENHPEGVPREANVKMRASRADSFERLVCSRIRSFRSVQQDQLISVRIPRDLSIMKNTACRLRVQPFETDRSATFARYAPGETNLSRWESFTSALLGVHCCIWFVQISIRAVSSTPRSFYRSFSMTNGMALVDVEVSAFRNPRADFILPFLRLLCDVRGAEDITVHLPITITQVHLMHRKEILDIEPLLDERFARLLQSTLDMPFLRQMDIVLHNTGTGPPDPQDICVRMTQHIPGDPWRLRYKVDGGYTELFRCESANSAEVSTTVSVDASTPSPRHLAHRELTGFMGEQVLFTVTPNLPPGSYIFLVISTVYRTSAD